MNKAFKRKAGERTFPRFPFERLIRGKKSLDAKILGRFLRLIATFLKKSIIKVNALNILLENVLEKGGSDGGVLWR
jgi:hypothetical protein